MEVLKIQDTKTLVTWNFLDHSIWIEKPLEYTYTDVAMVYELENGVYYSKTERMAETPLHLVARLTRNNDEAFKRFLNRNGARFKLIISKNDVERAIFCEVGNQVANIDFGIVKQYKFTLNSTTRPLRIKIFKSHDYPPEEFSNSQYGYITYGEARYNTAGSINNPAKAKFDGMLGDVNSYFEVVGITNGGPISLYVNGTTLNFANKSKDLPFYYSNLPDNKTIMINNRERIDLLDMTRVTNFEFDFRQETNIIEAFGLQSGAAIILYMGDKII